MRTTGTQRKPHTTKQTTQEANTTINKHNKKRMHKSPTQTQRQTNTHEKDKHTKEAINTQKNKKK